MVLMFAQTIPSMIDADVIRGLRLDGSPPCDDGLAAALRWIGSRRLPIATAIEEARAKLSSANFEWACCALGIYGYGDGSGYGYGDGYGEDIVK